MNVQQILTHHGLFLATQSRQTNCPLLVVFFRLEATKEKQDARH